MSRQSEIEKLCAGLLEEIGEDPGREGLQKTPARFLKAFKDLTAGYRQEAEVLVNGALFEAESQDMVVLRDIEIFSLCEHHLLPFYGKAHIGYIPDKKIIGLSKIPRIVNMYAKRLQVQERLTRQILDELTSQLKPLGAGCIIEATHMCTVMRGVQSTSGVMLTSAMSGIFMSQADVREAFTKMAGK